MANNYIQFSAFLPVPTEKRDQARAIVEREIEKLQADDDEGYCGTNTRIESEGVWFHEDESGTPEHVEKIGRSLIEQLQIAEPFVCTWAYTCSKPRIDEFGGGAFLIRLGKPTLWCDAERCGWRMSVGYHDPARRRPEKAVI